MEEIIAQRHKNLLILELNPGNLIHNLVSPFIKTLIANLDIAIKDPEEAKAPFLQLLHLQVHDLPVAHCVVV